MRIKLLTKFHTLHYWQLVNIEFFLNIFCAYIGDNMPEETRRGQLEGDSLNVTEKVITRNRPFIKKFVKQIQQKPSFRYNNSYYFFISTDKILRFIIIDILGLYYI